MKKLMNAIGLACDLAFPVILVVAGLAVIVGGTTGTLWL